MRKPVLKEDVQLTEHRDLWSRIEALRERPVPEIPPHLRMSAEQIRAEIANMTPDERNRLNAELDAIYLQLHRENHRREPEDVAAIFSFVAGLGCVIASPFVGDVGDTTYLAGGVLLVITIISWAIARRFRYRRPS